MIEKDEEGERGGGEIKQQEETRRMKIIESLSHAQY